MKKTKFNEHNKSDNEEYIVEEKIEELESASRNTSSKSKSIFSKTEQSLELPIIKNPISPTKSMAKKKIRFADDDILPSINKPTVPIAPPIDQLLKNAPIDIEKENGFDIQFNKIVKYTDYCPLLMILNHMKSLKSSNTHIKTMKFDGIECLTDMVFYLMYRYHSNDPIWSTLTHITLDSCKYVTDFGIELITKASGKKNLVVPETSTGCPKIFTEFYGDYERNDILTSKKLMKYKDNEEKLKGLKSFKLIIHNNTSLNMLKVFKHRVLEHRNQAFFVEYDRIKILNFYNYWFNAFEISDNCPLQLQSHSSIIMICINFDDNSYTNLAKKTVDILLYYLYNNFIYLSLALVVFNPSEYELDENKVLQEIRNLLNSILLDTQSEEDKIPKCLKNMEFQQQENFRDIIRLKHAIQKFLKSKNYYLINLTHSKDDFFTRLPDTYEPIFNHDGLRRIRTNLFTQTNNLVNQKKFEKRIIKLEEFIDEMLAYELFDFKTLMQTRAEFSNYGQEFIKWKSLLGECLYYSVENEQIYVIFDVKWFFVVFNKLQNDLKNKLVQNNEANLSYCNYEALKEPGVLDTLGISDVQQLDFILEIFKNMGLIMRMENEMFDRVIYPNDNILNDNKFHKLWPNSLNNCFEIRSSYNFFFKIPSSIIVELQSAFIQYTNTVYRSHECLICQEGCVLVCIKLNDSKTNLELSARVIDLYRILITDENIQTSKLNLLKGFICLFYEYKVVIESILLERNFPYKASDDLDNKIKVQTNFSELLNIEEFIRKPEDYFSVDHKFSVTNRRNQGQVETLYGNVNLKTELAKNLLECSSCGISDKWFKLTYRSFRKLYPYFKSEIRWKLRIIFSKAIMDAIDPERKSIASIFEIANEAVTFNGTDQMSPFGLNQFKMTLTSTIFADSIKCGVTIIQKATSKKFTVFLSARTRRITVMEENIVFNEEFDSEYKTASEPEYTIIRTQRYIKESRTKFKKMPLKYDDQMAFNQKVYKKTKDPSVNNRQKLLEDIRNFNKVLSHDANQNQDENAISAAENWIIKPGDSMKVLLTMQNFNTCEFSFFYNNEKIGFWLIDEWSECIAYPSASVKGATTKFFFDLNSLPVMSIMANELNFKARMFLEAEDPNDSSILSPAMIEQINHNTGELCIKLLGVQTKYWVEPSSTKIHPCGYWNYVQHQIYEHIVGRTVKHGNLKSFANPSKDSQKVFLWSSLFNGKQKRVPIPLELFTPEQHEGMIHPEFKSKYFPYSPQFESTLSCYHSYNLRYTWSVIDSVNAKAINEIISKVKTFLIDQNKQNNGTSGLVLLPTKLSNSFIDYPTLTILATDLFMNISCLHREDINLSGHSSLSFSFPHLLHGNGLAVGTQSNQLESKFLIMLLCTSLDLALSTNDSLFPKCSDLIISKEKFEEKQVNDAMRSFFLQSSFLFSIMLPIMFQTRYRFGADSFEDLIVDDFKDLFLENKSSEEQTDKKYSVIDDFIKDQIQEFGIDESGSCKYCNSLNLDFTELHYQNYSDVIDESIESNKEYSKIITQIFMHDTYFNAKKMKQIKFKNEVLEQLPNLSTFFINGLQIENIDDVLKNCTYLRHLELVNNNLMELPISFDSSRFLSQIIIENNPIVEIPAAIFCIRSLRSLILSQLNIKNLPDKFVDEEMNALDIRHLRISQTRLRNLPYDLIARNIRLESFTFQGVNFILPQDEQSWPSLLVTLDNLVSKYCPVLFKKDELKNLFKKYDYDKSTILNYVEAQHFNAFIFKNFERLGDDLDESTSDAFGGIPDFVFKCKSLTYLDFSFQAIRRIPDAIENLCNLKILKLNYCIFLEALSPSVGHLSLNELQLFGCVSLKTPPLEIQRRGVTSILAYLRRLRSGSIVCKRTKLMLVGLGGAGKTSLVQCLINKTAQKDISTPVVTDGISIEDWTIPLLEDDDSHSNLVLSVWDFAGQTVYYNTHQFFLTNRSIYLIVWSCRLGAEHAGLEFWLNSITCHAPLSPIFIVGTHIDEVSKYELPVEALKKRYPSIAGFHFVSCYDGTNIEQLSIDIINTALAEKYMGEKIPECWLQFEDVLKKMKLKRNLIEFSEILPISTSCGIFENSETIQAIQFLHDLGSLLYFNNEFLKDKVVINPQYIVDVMSCLVSIKNNYIIDGKLEHDQVSKIWSKYEKSLHPWILKLTEKFDLTFNVPSMKINLVPCLMPETAPENFRWPKIDEERIENPRKKEIIILYDFEYLPPGLFNRCQVRLFQISDITAIWKKGSLLKKNNHIGLIQKQDNRIQLQVLGVSPENVLFLIHEVLEGLISESFNGVRYDFSFPCPDCIDSCSIDIEKSMFGASLVRRASELKAAFLQCRQHFHAISIVDLHARFPPNSVDNYDLQLKHSIRDLKHLKEKLSYDVTIIYSHKDTEDETILHPRRIKIDLEKAGYNVWYSENKEQFMLQSLALVLKNSRLILLCISDNFVNTKECVDIFHYIKSILSKGYILVSLGQSLNWLTSPIGAYVSHEYFIKINTIERYESRSADLIEMVRKKVSDDKKNKKNQKKHQIFISYCHSNSHDAIAKGAPLKSELSLGWADPRSLKTFLENEGYSVWIDYEQVGSKNTLFEDIVDGIRNAKVVIACISNDYARSDSCMKEFRFTSNLKIPIILCTFGSPNAKSEWKNTELGIISCLINKEINFQLENPFAYTEVLEDLKEKGIELSNTKANINDETSDENDEKANELETAYSELFEVTQRRILRQLTSYTDPSRPFPHLFVIDLIEDLTSTVPASMPPTSMPIQNNRVKSSKRGLAKSHSVDEITPKICVKALCEYEGGWHVSGESLNYGNLTSIPEAHYAYWLRMMTLVKHSQLTNLNILYHSDKLNDLLKSIDDRLASVINDQSTYNTPSIKTQSRHTQHHIVELKDSFNVLRKYIQRILPKTDKNKNSNYIEHFDLNRCAMPSGKTLWLCPEHRKDEHIQVLKNDFEATVKQFQSDEYNTILLDQLKKSSNSNTNSTLRTPAFRINQRTSPRSSEQ